MRGGGFSVFIDFVVSVSLFWRNASSMEQLEKFNVSVIGDDNSFVSFREKFSRTYNELNSLEYYQRHVYFQESVKRHEHLNSFPAGQSAQYGINQFSDLSQDEFRAAYLQASTEPVSVYSGLRRDGLPARFDWRDKNAVGPVQDQKACGSCWAFSVVGAMQSVHAAAARDLVPLSVQQVLDCSYQNHGCNGGSTVNALRWLNQTCVKLVYQTEYPYKAQNGICHFYSQSHGGVVLKDFAAYDFSLQEEAMKTQLVERGPLVVTVDAVSWQDYMGGVIQHHCSSQQATHAVLVVGYDTTGDIPYWIVQNSWGTSWGNNGYVYIKIGGNICGVADSVAVVFL